MTGFGQAALNDSGRNIQVEVKSLNSKFLDLSLRLPKIFTDKELEIRNLVAEKLERGKISVSIEYVKTGKEDIKQAYDAELFAAYYSELKRLADKVVAPYDGLFELALNSPEVIQSNGRDELDPKEWAEVLKLTNHAIQQCEQFRVTDGKDLENKLMSYAKSIVDGLAAVEELDPQRIDRIRKRITGRIKEFFGEEGFDQNRLEQEIIFYIEKLDIHEERVRLRTHLEHLEQLIKAPQSNGKKLGFLSQEIGREINTIGSKANDAAIQKHVVTMKEELEKIKEQLGNVL